MRTSALHPRLRSRAVRMLRTPAWAGLLFLAAWFGLAAEPVTNVFRIGVSYASFGTVSRNDASAALKAWAATVARERRLSVKVDVQLFEEEKDLRAALARQQVDAASMTAEEFIDSGEELDDILVTARANTFTEQYVILTRLDKGPGDLSALKGRTLVRHDSPKTRSAKPWLEVLLAGRLLGSSPGFFSEISAMENPSKAILRVFFRQSDACLVTTNAFELACEMNPQLSKELRVLAVSPPLVPSLLFFRKNYLVPMRADMESAILDLHTTAAGLQVLTVFQGSRMLKRPVTCLNTTRQLLTDLKRLGQTNAQNEFR